MANLEDYKKLLNQFVVARAEFDERLLKKCRVEPFAREGIFHIHHSHSGKTTKKELNYRLSIEETDIHVIVDDWATHPAPKELKLIGDRWVEKQISVILQVPSAVVPGEHNYLVNPNHPHFNQINLSSPTDLPVDPRLASG